MNNKRNIRSGIILLLCLIGLPLSGNPAKKGKNHQPWHRIFNFEKSHIYSGWSAPASYNSIYNWGRSKNLFLIDDNAPLIDKKAVFVKDFNATIRIDRLTDFKNYTLWIDFVKFRGDTTGLDSRLKILIDDKPIDELNISSLRAESYYKLKIPRELTFDGKIKLTFDEYSATPGMWGIWDIILLDGGTPHDLTIKNKNHSAKKSLKVKSGLSKRNKKSIQRKNRSKKSKKDLKPMDKKKKIIEKNEKSQPRSSGGVSQSNERLEKKTDRKEVRLKKIPLSVKKQIDSIRNIGYGKKKKGESGGIKEPTSPIEPVVKK